MGTLKIENGTLDAPIQITDRRDGEVLPSAYKDYAISTIFSNTNNPQDYWYSGITVKGWASSYRTWQLVGNSDKGSGGSDLFYRYGNDSTWESWQRLLTSNNYSQYALSLSGGTMTGAINFSIHGVTGSIGPANSGWFHFYSDVSFYFDNNVFVKGALAIYNANSKGCGNTFPSNPSNGQIFFKFS